MGLVYADIELSNPYELLSAKKGNIDEDSIKILPVTVLVDTGAYTLAINQHIQEILELIPIDHDKVQLANGEYVFYDLVPIYIKFKKRHCHCNAVVLPGNSEPLLGAVPLELMDLVIECQRQELIPHPDHGEKGLYKMVGIRKAN